MPDARAVRLWEKIRQNLIDREMFSFDQDDDLDAEQIKAIEHDLGVDRELKGHCDTDKLSVTFTISKVVPNAPVIEAQSIAFKDASRHIAYVRLGEALTFEYREGRIHAAVRPKTW